jgi:hypothetical protein
MSNTNTPNFNLDKIDRDEQVLDDSVTKMRLIQNGNMDIIDTALGTISQNIVNLATSVTTDLLHVGDSVNYAQIDNARGLRYLGTITANWKDLRFPAETVQINPSTSKPDSVVFIGNSRCLGFDASTTERVTFTAQVPHDYKANTDLGFHLHWSTPDANAGSVVWEFEYSIAKENGVFNSPSTTLRYTISATGTAYGHNFSTIGVVAGASITPDGNNTSTMLICSLARLGGDDTYASDALFLECDFHYQADSVGSDQPNFKTY